MPGRVCQGVSSNRGTFFSHLQRNPWQCSGTCPVSMSSFSTTALAVQDAAATEPAARGLARPPDINTSSSSSSHHEHGSSAAVLQAPTAPGTPARPLKQQPQHGRQLAARHLREYLQSINSSGFVTDLAQGIRAGDRLAISRSLTLCESTRPDHALQAAALLRKLIDDNSEQCGVVPAAPMHQRQGQAVPQQASQVVRQVVAGAQGPEMQQKGMAADPPVHQAPGPNPQWPRSPLPPPHTQHPTAGQTSAAAAAAGSHMPTPTAAAAAAAEQPHPLFSAASSGSSSSALRVGLSGPPGAGKSSLIETWGCYLADHGSRVAVLAVDPSSMESGGAILGDKTRMARLSSHPNAYVRPSPARGTLGGVSRATFDAMLICEAAGYNRILVETVGVGQSEVAVADLVDCMILVMPPVGGDDLQMIKRGIMEVADIVAVNKADGETDKAAARAASEYGGCLHLMPHRYRAWEPQSLAVSAHTGKGVPALARLVNQFQQALTDSGELHRCRVQRAESVAWLSLEEQLLEGLRQDPHVRWLLGRLLPHVRAGTMAPRSAADIALTYFYTHCG